MINEIKREIKIKSGYECLNACILNWLQYFGVNVNSSDIYFAGEVSKIIYDKETHDLLVNAYQKNFSFFAKFGIIYIKRNSSMDKCKTVLRQILSEGHAVILKTCPEKLGYTNAFALNRNAPHFINILDINENDGLVFVIDGYVPKLKSDVFFGWISLDTLLYAWAEKDYEYMILYGLKDMQSNLIQNIAKRNFKETIRSYFDKDSNGTNNCKIVTKLFSDFFDRITNSQVLDEDYIEEFFFKIKVFGFMIEKQMILEKIYEESEELASEYEKILGQWNGILLFIRKAIYTKKIDRLEELYKRICDLIEKEIRLFEILF